MGGDTWLQRATPQRPHRVSIAGGDSWVGILVHRPPADIRICSFNRRWRFLGGDTSARLSLSFACHKVSIAGGDSWVGIRCQMSSSNQSYYVSIAGGDSWVGIHAEYAVAKAAAAVSIAGGDSWVGIPMNKDQLVYNAFVFQSQVAILGWGYLGVRAQRHVKEAVSIAGGDSWVGIHGPGAGPAPKRRSFNRRWRFLGGDTPAMQTILQMLACFNRRWRFLGGDTHQPGGSHRRAGSFNRRWRFLGGDTMSAARRAIK